MLSVKWVILTSLLGKTFIDILYKEVVNPEQQNYQTTSHYLAQVSATHGPRVACESLTSLLWLPADPVTWHVLCPKKEQASLQSRVVEALLTFSLHWLGAFCDSVSFAGSSAPPAVPFVLFRKEGNGKEQQLPPNAGRKEHGQAPLRSTGGLSCAAQCDPLLISLCSGSSGRRNHHPRRCYDPGPGG